MRQLILILKRQKPHLILFMVLSVLSGLAYYAGPAESSAMAKELPSWVPEAWAIVLLLSGLAGLFGIVWQRWRVERGMLMERGALLIQAGMVIMYGGVLVSVLGWGAAISAGAAAAWAGANIWEAALIRRDLRSIEEARGA